MCVNGQGRNESSVILGFLRHRHCEFLDAFWVQVRFGGIFVAI